MPKCAVCGFVKNDLRQHVLTHHLTMKLYLAKFPNEILIEPSLHEDLKAAWRAKATERKQKKLAKLNNTKTEKIAEKDTNTSVFTGKWYEYYSKIKMKYIDEYKFTEGPELDDLLFFLVSNRQLQEQYDLMVSNQSLTAALESNILNNIRQNNDRIQELLVTLIDFKQTREKTQDIVNLHDETLKKAAAFVKQNYGEFVFRCPDCGQMLDNFGFPHPFFEATDKYSVFSKELWELVVRKLMPIEYAAYILHTSIEGIINTAQFREEANIEIDLIKAEKNLKELHNVSQV